jgi:hypothetical protein
VANVLSFRAAPQNHISLGEIVSWVEKAVGGASQSWLPPRFYAALEPAEGRLRAEKPAHQTMEINHLKRWLENPVTPVFQSA